MASETDVSLTIGLVMRRLTSQLRAVLETALLLDLGFPCEEIEDALKGLAGVTDVQVVAVEISGRARCVAFVIPGAPAPSEPPAPRRPLAEWLRGWIDWDADAHEYLDSLPGVVWHATDAWSRRHEPNVVLAHYADLSSDLEGEMRRLADRLGITVPEDRWPKLVQAATFDDMRARAQLLAPDPAGIMKDRDAFFRRGTSGAGEEVLTGKELARYRDRVAELGAPEVVAWLHHGRGRAVHPGDDPSAAGIS